MLLFGPQFPHVVDEWQVPRAQNPRRRTSRHQLALRSGTGSCSECPSHALALPTPGHRPWASSGWDSLAAPESCPNSELSFLQE